MKKMSLIVFLLLFTSVISHAQEFETQQLLLDWQKLSALKHILNDLYEGYEILNKGYTAIKEISEGNFSLHEAFLDGLLLVSPAVQHYGLVKDIIEDQSRLVKEYKAAFLSFSKAGHFSPGEIAYFARVYGNLVQEGMKDLDHLTNVLTAGKLRMSDDERLHAIDEIQEESRQKLVFLRNFNNGASVLALQRATELKELLTLDQYYPAHK